MRKRSMALIVMVQLIAWGAARQLCAQHDACPIEVLAQSDDVDEMELDDAIRKILRKRANINLKQATVEEFAQAISDEFGIDVRVDKYLQEFTGIDPSEKFDWNEKNVSLGNALHSLLGEFEMGYAIKNGRLYLTAGNCDSNMIDLTYDVSDILAAGKVQSPAVVRRGITSSSDTSR